MRICLINPPWLFCSADDIVLSQNLGLGYLACFLREKGRHQVRILDALAQGRQQKQTRSDGTLQVGLTHQQIVAAVGAEVDLIGITVPFSHLALLVEELCQALKESKPSVPVILGGVHPSTSPQEYRRSAADYWLVGEGEQALLALANGNDPVKINGLLCAARPTLPAGEAATQMKNLDEIPLPARDLLPMATYTRLSPRRVRHRASGSIMTSRGCPWDCEFCSIHPMYGYQWRKRSAQNVLEEIRQLVENYGVEQLEFEDDNLTLDHERAVTIFDGLCHLQKHLDRQLTWGTPNGVRAETLDRSLLDLMKRSGCVRVTFALEHGDEDVRQSMGKKVDLARFEQTIQDSVAAGLRVEVFLMVGYPGETARRFETARKYYRKLSQWGVQTLHFFYPQPYPGTRLYQRCQEKGYLIRQDYSLMPPVKIETEDFDTAEVIRRRRQLLSEFDKTYRLRQRIKSILPTSMIATLNRLMPRKSM